jgi:UDP-N-acetylmuramate dehydrogenase
VATAARRPTLAQRTTLRVGGPADAWITATTDDALIAALAHADGDQGEVLVLGGGSNLLVADAGFPGTVVEVATRGLAVEEHRDHVDLRLAAGEPWDGVVAYAVERGWTGIEALSGIPGRVGATPVQNVGAYGQEIAAVVRQVRVLDRRAGRVEVLGAEQCGFGYRTSRFKTDPDRWVVLEVVLRLGVGGQGVPRYAELVAALGSTPGGTADVRAIRDAVLGLRRSKAMVLDDDDHDTWSAGSFFTNPIVGDDVAGSIPAACPRYPGNGGVKLSAAWLIENAGISRGYRLPGSQAAISSCHTLALTNRGGASAEQVADLARVVRAAVSDRFAITLVPEPRLVGLTL